MREVRLPVRGPESVGWAFTRGQQDRAGNKLFLFGVPYICIMNETTPAPGPAIVDSTARAEAPADSLRAAPGGVPDGLAGVSLAVLGSLLLAWLLFSRRSS